MATKLKPVDAVVVGTGVVGSIMAKELTDAGLNVVVLERGRMIDPQHDFAAPSTYDELKFDRHSDIFQDLSRETITFRNNAGERALPMREMGSFKPGEAVGGTALHWGTHSRRLLPWDFETRSRTVERYGKERMPENCTSQDWGITFEELEPYYDQFEHLYGVGGKAGNLNGVIQEGGNPFEGARSREYPNPPSPMTYAGVMFARACEELGYKPHVNPVAAQTQAYMNPYKLMLGQCIRGGFCTSHACSQGAKANPITTIIPALLKQDNCEIRPMSNVIRVNLDSDRKRATGVTYLDASGREFEQPADIVVLGAYTFNNVRLMLLSGIGTPYDPVANRGVVGRNYSYQSHGRVTMFFEEKAFNPFMGGGARGTSIDEFNADNFDHSELDFFGGAYIAVASSGAMPIRSIQVPAGTPKWGSEWKNAAARYYQRNMSIRLTGGCQSYRQNYLDLDPTYRDANGLPLLRMTFDWGENESKSIDWITKKAEEIANAMNPSRINSVGQHGHYDITPYQSTHNIGGAVMGADPATSAVNKYLQSWDVSNVFVIGGSSFPQNAANPPTETIGMLACWAADNIKETYLKRPGPMA